MRKNTFKKIIATLLSALLLFSCAMPAFATETETSVTEITEELPGTDVNEPTEDESVTDETVNNEEVAIENDFEFSDVFASLTEMALPVLNFIANNYGDVYEEIIDSLFSLYDQFVFFFCGRVSLHEGPVYIAFSGEAFGDVTQELELYVEEIDYEECGTGTEGYIDYSIVPTEGDFQPIAYRIALLDEDGKPHFIPLFQTHRIQHTFDTPAEWAEYQEVTVTRYHKFDNESEASSFSETEYNDELSQQVFFVDYVL